MRYVVNRNPDELLSRQSGCPRGPAQHSSERLPSAGLRPLEEEEETVPKPLADHRLAHIYIPLHKQLYKLIS